MFPTVFLTACALLPTQVSPPSSSQESRLAQDASRPPAGDETILIDWLHANDFSMIGLRPKTYRYHVLTGYRRAFDFLQSRGISRKYLSDGQLTLQRLAPHKLLFINLVSAEREPFLVSEIKAIRSFVAEGGSLFIITDHSNCYFHAHRLKPLLTELGIRSFTVTSCEEPPRSLGSQGGWISITDFSDHPVTANLGCLALQTGGCVDPDYAVAWTSDQAWADEWVTGIYGEENAPGFYGDFRRNTGEATGPLGVVLAKTLGSGRIVIAADQNMFSDDFFNYGDNYRLWLNIMAWLLRDESLQSEEAYLRWASPRLLLFERYETALFGREDEEGYYRALAFLNRYHRCFANDRPTGEEELVVIASNELPLTAEQAQNIAGVLQRGNNVLLLSSNGKVLETDDGVVRTVLRELPASPPKLSVLPGRVEIQLPHAGAIHVLTPSLAFDNRILPPPTRPPSAEEQRHSQALLDAVRQALGN